MSLAQQWGNIYGNEYVIRNFYYNIMCQESGISIFFQDDILKQNYKVISGHFPAAHCESINNAFRLTFLRHPLDNLLSLYSMILASHWNVFAAGMGEAMSFGEFIAIPRFRWLYTRTFFGGFNMDLLDFVGDVADYDNELLRLGEKLGVKFDPSIKVNGTGDLPNCPVEYKKNRAELLTQIHNNDSLKETLADDIVFYNRYKGR
jgi:hypothetical protein